MMSTWLKKEREIFCPDFFMPFINHLSLNVMTFLCSHSFLLQPHLSDPSSGSFTNFFLLPITGWCSLFLSCPSSFALVMSTLFSSHFCFNSYWCHGLCFDPLAFNLAFLNFSFYITTRETFQSKSHQSFPFFKHTPRFPVIHCTQTPSPRHKMISWSGTCLVPSTPPNRYLRI